jgi:hypothetical protein
MGESKTMHVVVLDGREDRYAAEVTAAIAEALTDIGKKRASDEAARPSSPDTRTEADVIHAADTAVVLDPGSLERARESGVRMCAVVFPGFDLAWGGELGESDLVVVAHERLVPHAIRRGAPHGRVVTGGLVAPRGFTPAKDRAALRREAGIEGDFPLVLVPSLAFEEEGFEAVLVQLDLVGKEAGFLFDVGTDAEAADTLRRLVPAHDLRAWMFAEEPGVVAHYQMADVVLARAHGYEVARALAVGAPLVLLPAGRSSALAADTLEALGVGTDADVLATLSVTLDAALEPEALEERRAAVRALDVADGAMRVAMAVHGAWRERGESEVARRGLPKGLEKLVATVPVGPQRKAHGDLGDIEDRVERELRALKEKLTDG